MNNKGQLFREANALYHNLLELYFENAEHFGPTKYNAHRIATAVQRALSRLARRRDQFINETAVQLEGYRDDRA